MTTSRVRRVRVPRDAPGVGAFTAPGYASAFELTAPGTPSLTPEQWARTAFEGAPGALRRLLVTSWSGILGLGLGPRPSPRHVLGWLVSESGPGSVTLEARSRLMTARNVIGVDGTKVVWTTLVRFEQRMGRLVWSAAAPVHHAVIPCLLTRAAGTAARG
ncbi:DUF2867 domain-containing protein [Streptomyces roseoverticillatus]|uniref:DUF2867 domain-containing protein n=1 Tax=Streptomyces roseoverticillatus TaxID=66429 RepID=UPI001F171B5C|nr:DUF2867 domain-containing protein [Streptomyces roseoverticillatus]MCF3101293.1 DUF2867 domain-containing protein [Streptomyces roseoverticillatus]